jgi:hypothetical protein
VSVNMRKECLALCPFWTPKRQSQGPGFRVIGNAAWIRLMMNRQLGRTEHRRRSRAC